MTDLTESRISEMRESRDKLWKVWPFYVLKCWHAEAQATIAERRQLHGNVAVMLAEEWDALRPEVGTLLADLEALLAEREGMKAALKRVGIEWSTEDDGEWTVCLEPHGEQPCASLDEALARLMKAAENDGRLSAPLDPSSAPGIGRIVARYASETRRLRAELESARSPEREAGSGTACPDDPPCDECLERSMDDAETAGKVIDLMAALKESLGLDVSHPVPSEGGGE